MLKQQKIFFDFLRFCIGSAKEIPGSLKEADWKVLYAIAKKQALLGVLFYGIRRLPKELAPEQKLLMQWMVMAEQIRKQNIRLFQDSVKVCQNFENEGFANCILKGQGNALLYPNPYMRTPGDIDIYLSGGRRKIMKYVDRVCPNQVMRYHHVDFPVMKTAIEVHFTPSYMFCPIHNRRMQKWFQEVMGEQCNHRVSLPDGYGEIHVPTASFNVIYILSHLYRHIFTEGIGLRQLLDYYYVVCDFCKVYQISSNHLSNFSNHPVPLSKEGSTFSPSPSSSGSGDVTALRCSEPLRSKDGGPSKVSPDCAGWDRLDGSGDTTSACSLDAGSSFFSACSSVALDVVQRELKHLGLWKFAQAVMFVMKEVFGLSEDRMIAPMDEKEGRFLLDEIMRGGNFGQYDDRMGSKVDESKIHRYFRMNLRNLRFVKHYPTEAVCEPVFRTWFAGWKFFINRIK
ncbi:nucleotidyltransferase domain-containing protein [Segatella copri]|uniref:nucleotidyltransferase domain-containing protein n=1 Tax=Segatella copri TaxID=165179 RepID=UPI003F71E70E